MNLEPIIGEQEIRELNRQFGGNVRYDSSVAFAIEAGRGKSCCRKIALLLRAIAAQHPFTDANKRTALVAALTVAERSGIAMSSASAKKLSGAIKRIAEEHEEDMNKIERWVRYAFEGH